MIITEHDEVEDTLLTVPVLVRVHSVDDTESGFEVGIDPELPDVVLRSRRLIFNLTEDATVVAFDESFGFRPFVGRFDDTAYLWTEKILSGEAVDDLLQASATYL